VEASPDTVIAGFKELQAAIENGRRVHLVSTTQDAEKLSEMGFHAVAVTVMINGHVDPAITEPFRSADVLVILDEGEYSYRALKTLGIAIKAVASSVRYLDLQKFAGKARSHFTVSQWIEDNQATPDELGGVIDRATEEAGDRSLPGADEFLPERRTWKYGPVKWSERNAVVSKPYEFQIAKIIPRRELVLFYGESQSGKSFTAFDMGVHVASGQEFQGQRVLQGGVIYCFIEKGNGARVRMQAFQMHNNLPDDLPFAALTKRFDLFNDDETVKQLAEECKAIAETWDVPLDVIVIDTHDAATPGANEVEKRDVSKTILNYKRLIELTGAGVWVIHHANASGNLRGSLILYNAIETVISITPQEIKGYGPTRDEDGRQIRRAVVKKQSEGEAGFAWDFVLRQVEVGKNEHGEPITSCVVSKPNGGNYQGPRQLAPNAKIIFKALLDALSNHGIAPPPSVRVAKSITTIVDRSHWIAEYDRKAADMEPDPAKREARVKKAMQRAITQFTEKGYIGVENIGSAQWVWWTGKTVPGVTGTSREVVSEQMSDTSLS
jgi:hypothetical protein